MDNWGILKIDTKFNFFKKTGSSSGQTNIKLADTGNACSLPSFGKWFKTKLFLTVGVTICQYAYTAASTTVTILISNEN